MQLIDRISLNALRVFATVAECGSMKLAAARLGETLAHPQRRLKRRWSGHGQGKYNERTDSAGPVFSWPPATRRLADGLTVRDDVTT